jgi:GTP cyclohydrolase I
VIEDVQATRDDREIPLDRAGVSGLRHPITVLDWASGLTQDTVGVFTVSVSLPCEQKGTHMSRFVEVLNDHHGEVTMRTIPVILHDLRKRLYANRVALEVTFPYFMDRIAPVSGAAALMDYETTFTGATDGTCDDFVLRVKVPVTSLCPCSKAISERGAHNQRGYIAISVRSVVTLPPVNPALIWIEELVEYAERSASAPVYPLLKRVDEKFVTEQAYDNPVFVEDMVRNTARRLMDDPRVAWFEVHAEKMTNCSEYCARWTRFGCRRPGCICSASRGQATTASTSRAAWPRSTRRLRCAGRGWIARPTTSTAAPAIARFGSHRRIRSGSTGASARARSTATPPACSRRPRSRPSPRSTARK